MTLKERIKEEEMKIYYKEGYLYQVNKLYKEKIDIYPEEDVYLPFLFLSKEGDLEIKVGYAHDGPSGPCKFMANRLPGFLKKMYLKSLMRGATKHDAGYQMIREGKISLSTRPKWDEMLHNDCITDKMTKARAWRIYTAVKKGAEFAAKKEAIRKQMVAP